MHQYINVNTIDENYFTGYMNIIRSDVNECHLISFTIRRKDLSSEVVDAEVNRKCERVSVHGRRQVLAFAHCKNEKSQLFKTQVLPNLAFIFEAHPQKLSTKGLSKKCR